MHIFQFREQVKSELDDYQGYDQSDSYALAIRVYLVNTAVEVAGHMQEVNISM